jgi:hypothetical protein
MNHVTVKISAVGDPPAFPEIKPDLPGECRHVAILEAGTTSGATSMGMIIHLPEGRTAFIQFTAGMFLTIAGAVKGAVDRFGK